MTSQLKKNLLSLTGVAVFVFLASCSFPSTNKNTNHSNGNSANSATPAKVGGGITYTNSSEHFTGTLEENNVDFSFTYPVDWKRDPEAGKTTSPNFVKVEHATDDDVTLENFAVGYFTGQSEVMPKLASQLSQKFSSGFPEYKKASEGPTHIGKYDGYEFRFTSHSAETSRGPLDIWGRVILLPGSADRKGATLIMLATSASDAVKSVNDLGEKGELPAILSSFKFAKD